MGKNLALSFCSAKYNVSLRDEYISDLVFLVFDKGGTY